jgi:dihydroflavonol-4-reductase
MSYGVTGLESLTRPPEGFESELLGFFATGGVLVDNSKAKRELGIDHRPFEESLRLYLEWDIEQQGLDQKITGEIA